MGVLETILLLIAAVVLTWGVVEGACIIGEYLKEHQI